MGGGLRRKWPKAPEFKGCGLILNRANGFSAVPVFRHLANVFEELAFRTRDIGKLNHCPRVTLGFKVTKATVGGWKLFTRIINYQSAR